MTTDFTARVIRGMIGSYRRSAVDKPLRPSIPLPPSPSPPSPNDPSATAAYIVAAARKARGLPQDDENQADDKAPPRPGQLVLDAVRRQREGK
jgi:hypothetical protein